MVGIWEIGILLAGIGLLILCIFTGVTIRDFGILAKKLDKIIDANEEEIKMISKSTAGIANSIDSISARVDKIFGLLTAFEQLKSLLSRKKTVNKSDVEDIFEEVAENYYEEETESQDDFKNDDTSETKDDYKAE